MKLIRRDFDFETGFVPLWYTLWFMIATGFFGRAIESFIGYRAVGFTFLLGVLIVSLLGSRAAAFFSGLFSALVWNFFFIPPRFTFAIASVDDLFMCLTYFIVAIAMSAVMARVKQGQHAVRAREDQANALYEILQKLSSHFDPRGSLPEIAGKIGTIVDGACAIFLAESPKGSTPQLSRIGIGLLTLSEDEYRAAGLKLNSANQAIDRDDGIEADLILILLANSVRTFGVLAVRPVSETTLTKDQAKILNSLSRHLTLALERRTTEQQAVSARNAQELAEVTQVLRLNSDQAKTSENSRERLARALALVDPSIFRATLERHHPTELIAALVKRIGRGVDGGHLKINFLTGGGLFNIDVDLLTHAFAGITDHVFKNFQSGKVGIRLESKPDHFLIILEHSNATLVDDDLAIVDERSMAVTTSQSENVFWIGKKLIQLHGGRLWMQNRIDGGFSLVVSLPQSE